MQWQGKIIGAVLGGFAGPVGAVTGFVLGHLYDAGASGGLRQGRLRGSQASASSPRANARAAEIRDAFYDTTFAVMGHLAKYDGRVSQAEIDAARNIMRYLNLGEVQVERAIACFGRGKTDGYPLSADIGRLRMLAAGQPQLLRLFMELQLRAAIAGNGLVEPVRTRLILVGEALGCSAYEFTHLEMLERLRAGGGAARPAGSELNDAYAVLSLTPQASDEEVKKAYRRQMSENHPDKLVARGLPESMQELAKEKTQRVRAAYETIAAHRGFR